MAEYLPITDPEIAPEAPGASILFHKIRDNPIAISEGATGAPRIQSQALEVSFGSVEITGPSNRVLIPGGTLSLGWEVQWDTTDPKSVNIMTTPAAVVGAMEASVNASAGQTGTINMNWHYLAPLSSSLGWLYILKEKSTGKSLARWWAPNYVSYGQSFGLSVGMPFGDFDNVIHDVYVIPMTKNEYKKVLYSTIPITGGGYLTDTLFTAGSYNVDYNRPERFFFESFDALYDVDYATVKPWSVDPIFIGYPNKILNNYEPVTRVISQPAHTNCRGLIEL